MILNKEDYKKYADCIRSDQVSAPEVAELFENKKFKNWYRKTYLYPEDRKYGKLKTTSL